MITLQKKLSIMKHLNGKPKKVLPIQHTLTRLPPLSLLKDYTRSIPQNKLDTKSLETTFQDLGFEGSVVNIHRGPVISRYDVKLAKGVKLNQVRTRSEDIGLALMSGNVRILAPIPGTNLVGIEVANETQDIIGLRSILENHKGSERLPLAIGVDTVGQAKIFDLTKMLHLLIAGQTGSGKSVCINSIILSILFTKTPDECQLILVDPKRVEMTPYHGIPHLRCPVITEASDAPVIFSSLIEEMERRYEVLADNQVRNIESYNDLESIPKMPYIVTIVDEMADLMMTSGKDLEKMIVRLAQLARAVGIHLILATQKPIVDVITGLIKSNMPSRIAFKVSSNVDSRVILDCSGAEKLVGRGDMLALYPGIPEPERYHGAWVSDSEIQAVCERIK
jgi:S-DNA-T family DNA segregation ATPase FtsK/SpoIIIE